MEPRLVALQQTSVTPSAKLLVSLELGNTNWHVAASNGGTRVCEYTVQAGDGPGLLGVLERARARLGLGKDAAIVSCYEAGRDGFWLHRFLQTKGIHNHVVDAGSIEVNRRQRRAKTDRLDVRKLLSNLARFLSGEKNVWAVLRVPSEAEEDERRPHRERARLVAERSQHIARMKSLLVMQSIRPKRIGARGWSERLKALVLPPRLREELERETERLVLVNRQLAQLEREQAQRLAPAPDAAASQEHPGLAKQRQLQRLRGLGTVGPWVLVCELFGWRSFNNRRELAGSVGLGSSPYRSGDLEHDQGISKAGNARVRTLMIELAWAWLRYQPNSALSKWYHERFGRTGGRSRRVGIVALARRLLIALWRFVEHGVIPEGATLKAV
jgi:transposase